MTSEFAWCEALVGVTTSAPDEVWDDARLVEEILRTGDDEPFAILVQRYKDRVLRLVASILGPSADAEAEDVVQEIFVTVYRKLETFRGDCLFSTWLYRLARNRAIDGRRRPKRYVQMTDDPHHANSEQATIGPPPVEGEYTGREELVLREVDELGEPRRTVVFLYYWMGCDVGEIAGLTEIPAGTVKSHLHRARRELASSLSREVIDG